MNEAFLKVKKQRFFKVSILSMHLRKKDFVVR